MFDIRGYFIRKVYFYEKYFFGGVIIIRDGYVVIVSKLCNKIFIVWICECFYVSFIKIEWYKRKMWLYNFLI